jgi:hypothetical protein
VFSDGEPPELRELFAVTRANGTRAPMCLVVASIRIVVTQIGIG